MMKLLKSFYTKMNKSWTFIALKNYRP
jgi:hypothetical protein